MAQLVAALLLQLKQLSAGEVQSAALHLCQLAQHRVDGPYVARIATALQGAYDAAVAAAAESTALVAAAGSGPSGAAPSRSAMQAVTPAPKTKGKSRLGLSGEDPYASDSRDYGDGGGGVGAMGKGPLQEVNQNAAGPPTPARVYLAPSAVTPAASKSLSRLSLAASTAKKTGTRSRLGAMKTSTATPGPAGVQGKAGGRGRGSGDGAGDLAMQLAAVLVLEQEEEEEQEQGRGEAAAAAVEGRGGVGRRVRFQAEVEDEKKAGSRFKDGGEEDEEMEDVELMAAVPPSVARHAIKRSARVAPAGTKAAAAASITAAVAGSLRRSCVVPSVASTLSSSSSKAHSIKGRLAVSRMHALSSDASEYVEDDEHGKEGRGVKAAAAAGLGCSMSCSAAAGGGGAGGTCRIAVAEGTSDGVADSTRGGCGQKQEAAGGIAGRAWCPSVVLVLDGDVQQLPWESLPGLEGQDMYR